MLSLQSSVKQLGRAYLHKPEASINHQMLGVRWQ
jgi:hypothetical protein